MIPMVLLCVGSVKKTMPAKNIFANIENDRIFANAVIKSNGAIK
jgi:hypothetical protein